MNTADYIVKRLEELGINDFFGVPGDYNFNLLYAVENNPNTNWIGCTNELNAGYAADGYARIRGYGALITTYGVGELSAINAIAGCMAENIPVFHIVGLPSTKNIERKNLIHHNYQDVDYQNIINAYKALNISTALLTRENAKIEIDRLIKILVREKKPVYAAIPEDIALMDISDKVISYEWTSDKNILEDVSAKIVEKIKNSQHPVIIGDILVKRFDAKIEFNEFVSKSGIPISNFLMGTNLINMNYEKYIGTYLGDLRNPIAQKYIEETDCLIAIGTIYSDLNSFGQKLPFNINDNIAIYGNYTYVDGIRYDNVKMSELLDTITKLVEPKVIEFDRPNIGLKNSEHNDNQLSSEYIYTRIQDFIKDNDIIIAETGTVPFGVSQIKFPESADIQMQLLWGSIGWATPATLGVCLAKPQSGVILISGEGAHQISAMEIGNMVRFGVKPVIIVINNGGYSTERLLSGDTQDKFNDIMQMNYAKFARVFDGDIWSTKVTTAEDFDKALRVTQIMDKLCYIEVCIDSMDVPSMAREYLQARETNSIENSSKSFNNIYNAKDFVLTNTSSDCIYETVVHKAFKEDLSEEKEID